MIDVIEDKDILSMENIIDKYDKQHNYFIRFRTESSARINEARVRCRELEVELTKFLMEKKIRPEIYRYINRLSDLLFILACHENSE